MFWKIVFLLAIVFVLTYDPKSRTLEKFVGQPTPPTDKSKELNKTKDELNSFKDFSVQVVKQLKPPTPEPVSEPEKKEETKEEKSNE
jgi:hypothetical protein